MSQRNGRPDRTAGRRLLCDRPSKLVHATAAAGVAVLAVRSESPYGHVALILDGPLKQSGKWGLVVPNSTSAFLNDASQTFVADLYRMHSLALQEWSSMPGKNEQRFGHSSTTQHVSYTVVRLDYQLRAFWL